MNNTRRSVLLAMSVALLLPGCAPESESDDAGGFDPKTVASPDEQGSKAGSAAGDQSIMSEAILGGDQGASATGGCSVFPANNWWNTDISGASVDARSAAYVATIGSGTALHPDFGTQYGIPSAQVDSSVAKTTVTFDYADESDPGPYPIPANPPVENGDDKHILLFHTSECKLYELYATSKSGSKWHAGSGAIWDLTKNSTRPKGWTSADAAGLPIYPGLVRYEEVASGVISHALRFTAPKTQHGYVAPASHFASSSYDTSRPPMGVRFRLKASFNINGYSGPAKVILTALKKYGMFLADNGSSWYLSGSPSPSWDDNAINALKQVHGGDFEAITTGAVATH